MEFEWDENKEQINIRKHGVDFSEAEEAFEDENAIDNYDESHSDKEHRFALIGLSTRRLLFVSYTVRRNTIIRLISARKANQNQERFYKNARK